MQSSSPPLRLRHSAGALTDAAGLVLLRRVWDALGVGAWFDGRAAGVRDRYRPSLMTELWVAPLFHDGAWMDDRKLFGSRGVRRLCGRRPESGCGSAEMLVP